MSDPGDRTYQTAILQLPLQQAVQGEGHNVIQILHLQKVEIGSPHGGGSQGAGAPGPARCQEPPPAPSLPQEGLKRLEVGLNPGSWQRARWGLLELAARCLTNVALPTNHTSATAAKNKAVFPH